MYIVDGIAYAGEMEKSISIISVRPLADYKLWIRFSNGEKRIYDCTNLLKYPAFQKLKDKDNFNSVYVDYGIPVWCNGEIDLCPHSIYEESVIANDILPEFES